MAQYSVSGRGAVHDVEGEMAVHTVTGSMARYGIVGVWSSYDVGLDLLEVEIINFQVTGIGLFSGSGFKTATVTGDISATASLSGVGNIEAIIVGSIVGVGSLETDATGAHTGVAELDSLGDPQSEGTSARSGEVDITGIGIFAPDGSKAFTDDGHIEGIGITVADVFKTGVANAIIVGEGIAQGNGASTRTVNAALDSIGNPAATGGINATDDGTIVGVGALASDVIKNALQTGTIVGVGSLTGDGDAGASGGNDANTTLLLHFDGADASTTFTDSSIGGAGSPHTVTPNNNAQIDTAQSKFGGASGLFDGVNDYLTVGGHADHAFGTGDFTIDFWYRPASVTGALIIYDSRPTSTQGVYPTVYTDGTALKFFTDSADRVTGATVLAINTWYHIAIARSGTSTKLFLNGVQEGSTYSDSNDYLNGTGRPAIMSSGFTLGGNEALGHMDELRVSKGIARWTVDFTPPTAAYF
jgi:hypothetical protein